ncbi:cleft lip and palate transmembrane protein 1 (clptm1) protein [Besnoitia besnoiti]|uniref:Cleft lip and palate transmembrane protein 1 (Clptm1) protein n=1 Tax=Besnoitia besnoiti TaxID=94643 RepID=A0A2A9MIM3_BESBE|nr:cleft lip and palate transmembrane protein 1 (clptm1) protein [Besnoitia besnoiti]PFH35493.1 cleft lip and palate transmembrane protein 1 (clptm1) protein [Besnoitia besnoiti]
MADAAAAAEGAAGNSQAPQQQSFLGRIGGLMMQVMMFQAVMQLVTSFTSSRQPLAPPAGPAGPDAFGDRPGVSPQWPNMPANLVLHNYFPPDTSFDVYMHLAYFKVPVPPVPVEAPAAGEGSPSVSSLLSGFQASLKQFAPPTGAPPSSGSRSVFPVRVPLKLLADRAEKTKRRLEAREAQDATAGEDILLTVDRGRLFGAPRDSGENALIRVSGNVVEAWKVLNSTYAYARWSTSPETNVTFTAPADFLTQPVAPTAAAAAPQPAPAPLTAGVVGGEEPKAPEAAAAGGSGGDKGQADAPAHAEEKGPTEQTSLCLITTVVPHWAYKDRRNLPEMWQAGQVPEVEEMQTLQRVTSLMQAMPLVANKEEEHSLLLGGEQEEKRRKNEKQDSEPVVWHLKNRLDVSLVFDSSQHTPQNLRVGPMQNVVVRPADAAYEPVLFHSDFWLLEKNFVPLNETLADRPLNLTLSFGVGSIHGWLVQEQLGAALEHQQRLGLQSTREAMMFKRIIIETNPFMLAFSTAFILLHSVFSFFAFKNDMQFWYKNDSMEGLSALSLIFNFVCEVIIGLYLFDSGETSWLILFEICLGILLSAWKVTKAVKLAVQPFFPYVKVDFMKSYTESHTQEFDSVAIRWMSIILAPCVAGYAIYALLHNKYRSWFSYIISVLAGSVYTFGFITMTPQLYINYKLKSVDHLPWRALVYRSLNTFVDDVASFLIDMPWMHRLSCFRDDIIFVCYLYQRWIYKVDQTRTLGGPPAPQTQSLAPALHRDEDLQQRAEQRKEEGANTEDDGEAARAAAASAQPAPNAGNAPEASRKRTNRREATGEM